MNWFIRARGIGAAASFVGVLAVESHGPNIVQAPVPVGVLQPELRIGSSFDSAVALTRVPTLTVRTDGWIYVAQPQETTIKVFDSHGQPQSRIGRNGGGPGEFRTLTRVGWLGDTLWTIDSRLRRVTFFSQAGAYLGEMPMDYVAGGGSGVALAIDGLLETGVIIGEPVAETRLALGRRVAEMPVVMMTRDGSNAATLEVRDLRKRRFIVQSRQGVVVSTYQPLDDSPLIDISSDGSALVSVERAAATDGSTHSFRILKITPTMDTVFAREVAYLPVKVPQAVADSFVSQGAKALTNLFGSLRSARDAALRAASPATATHRRPGQRDVLLGNLLANEDRGVVGSVRQVHPPASAQLVR